MNPTLRSAAVAFSGIGAVLCAGMAWILWSDAAVARARRAEIADWPLFHDAPDEARCVLEGRASPGRPLAGGFLAFERRRHERRGYAVLARETQALRIETARGSVEFAAPDYAFDADVVAWWHAEQIEQEPSLSSGATVLHGLLPGRDLVAFGVALASATAGEPRRFAAEAVAAGTIAGYRQKLEAQAALGGWPVYLSGGASLLLCFSTVRQARRLRARRRASSV